MPAHKDHKYTLTASTSTSTELALLLRRASNFLEDMPQKSLLLPNLYDKAGKPLNWEKYVPPGPPKYAGKYEAPKGPKPVVSDKDRGVFPKEFQVKYDALKKKWDEEGLTFGDKLNKAQDNTGHNAIKSEANLGPIFAKHFSSQRKFEKELTQLKKEAVKLGIAQ